MASDGILIIEDHRLLAQTLATALADRGLRAEVAEVTQLGAVVARVQPGTVVLLDLRLGAVHGGSLIGPLRARGAHVVVLTASTDAVELACAWESGALAVLDKRQPFAAVVDAIVAARLGGPMAGQARRQAVLRAAGERRAAWAAAQRVLDRLTPRETAVLDELCEGRTAEQIALHDHVSLATVRAQIRAVLDKLGARCQLQAVARAHALREELADGWEPPPA